MIIRTRKEQINFQEIDKLEVHDGLLLEVCGDQERKFRGSVEEAQFRQILDAAEFFGYLVTKLVAPEKDVNYYLFTNIWNRGE